MEEFVKINSSVYYYMNLLKCCDLHKKIYFLISSLSIYFPNILKDWFKLCFVLDNFVLFKPTWQGKTQSGYIQFDETINLSLIDINKQSFKFFTSLLNSSNIDFKLDVLSYDMEGKVYNNYELEAFKFILNQYLRYITYLNDFKKSKVFVDKHSMIDEDVYRTSLQLTEYDTKLALNRLKLNSHILNDLTNDYFIDIQFKPFHVLFVNEPNFKTINYNFETVKFNEKFSFRNIIFGFYGDDIDFIDRNTIKKNNPNEEETLLLILEE